MTEKLKMEQNPLSVAVEKIKEICPAAVTSEGKIDFEELKTALSDDVAADAIEKYEFTWVGKNAAKAEANRPIRKTLRPVVEDSKNWDTTKNLYIEGDNLDALKLLQESYLGKVKMIYIDPPYNTGNDFVYCDEFAACCEEYLDKKGLCDADGNRLFVNTETNGRFHSDWCTMIYPRLKVARDLLADDGVMFISIDDNEIANLRKICDEVFGEGTFLGQFVWQKKTQPSFLSREIASVTEYVLCYKRNKDQIALKGGFIDMDRTGELINIGNPIGERVLDKSAVEIENGKFTGILKAGDYGNGVLVINLLEDVNVINGIPQADIKIRGRVIQSQNTLDNEIAKGAKIFIKSTKTLRPTIKVVREEIGIKPPISLLSKKLDDNIPTNTDASSEIKDMFEGVNIMSYPKPSKLLKYLADAVTYNSPNSIILDFFSGSATMAQAVMQLNAEDGGHRKFIMVQLPELCDEKSEAFKAGYKNICEIGKERIRRAGEKIKSENPDKDLDIGFRVLRIDSTNMKDVYYKPSDTTQKTLLDAVDNIKSDRSDMDLLFGVMVDCGLPLLDKPIETKICDGKKYYVVNGGDYLVACFEPEISEKLVYEIANLKPTIAVFRDSSFADAKDKVNVSEIFKNITGRDDCVKVL